MHVQNIHGMKTRSKRGFGIMEVLIAAMVLGILYAAVSNLQKGNRDALFRIRGRDGATEVAQNIVDKMGALGVAHFTDSKLKADAEGNLWLKRFEDKELTTWLNGATQAPDTIVQKRTWKGQPGLVSHDMDVTYKVIVKISGDNDYKATETSQLLNAESSSSVSHIFAKRMDVTVKWCFKCTNGRFNQSISVSGVIR